MLFLLICVSIDVLFQKEVNDLHKKKILGCLILSLIVLTLGIAVIFDVKYQHENLENDVSSRMDEKIENISFVAKDVHDVVSNDSIREVAVKIHRFEVFDGLTIEELSDKLNRSLNGVLSNKGEMIATKCVQLGIDPYLAVGIMLLETGCSFSCSYLSTTYYNVGGMVANSGYYQKFSNIDEGIDAFLNNLYYNYYEFGLNTAEKINPKYAESPLWSEQVNNYIKLIKEK